MMKRPKFSSWIAEEDYKRQKYLARKAFCDALFLLVWGYVALHLDEILSLIGW